jgi:hypothetical protein
VFQLSCGHGRGGKTAALVILIAITIDNKSDVIRYKFFWPDYFLLTTLVAAFLIFNGGYLLKDDFLFLLLAIPFWAGIIFLDTKYVSSRVRKALLKLSNK